MYLCMYKGRGIKGKRKKRKMGSNWPIELGMQASSPFCLLHLISSSSPSFSSFILSILLLPNWNLKKGGDF